MTWEYMHTKFHLTDKTENRPKIKIKGEWGYIGRW